MITNRSKSQSGKIRYLGLLVLLIFVVFSIIAGVFQKLNSVNVPANGLDGAKSGISKFHKCQPQVHSNFTADWTSNRNLIEDIWQSNIATMGNPYFIGDNGWIFWNDYIDSYASQAVGRRVINSQEVKSWHSYLGDLQEKFSQQGIDFYVIIAPSTSSIYPEELPGWMHSIMGPTSMDFLMSQVSDLPVIDLRQGLLSAKKSSDFHLYSWSNSHWTDFGAYIAWSQIADCVNTAITDAGPLEVPIATSIEVIGDFNEWAQMGVESPGADWAKPKFEQNFQDVTVYKDGKTEVKPGTQSATDLSDLPVQTSVEDSSTGKSALIIRDSMGTSLSPYLQQAYSPTWQFEHFWDSPENFPDYDELLSVYHPNVVILELAERHLISAPNTNTPR